MQVSALTACLSRIFRCFVPPHKIRRSTITIDDPQQVHHIRDVLRLGVGDQLTCFDGQGSEYLGTVIRISPRRLLIEVDRKVQQSQTSLSVWLATGLLKADRFEWVVQKATELGVARLSPLVTSHTVVRPHPFREAKLLRWQRIAQEAAKQCGRSTIPSVDPPRTVQAFLPLVEGVSLILMPTLAVTTVPLSEVVKTSASAKEVVILIGPEGDFSREEVALAQRSGARPVSLGPLTLRSETAALATVAILQYALGRV